MNQLSLSESSIGSSQNFQLQDQYDQFPSLSGQSIGRNTSHTFSPNANGFTPSTTPSGQRTRSGLSNLGPGSRPQSRPSSRHQNRPETPSSLSVDDPEAFPTLGSTSTKRGSKHHGHRSRHGHNSAEKETASSLADVLRMSPSPAPGQTKKNDSAKKLRPFGGSESAAVRKIPEPQHIPWLETGAGANQQYLKFRQEAIKHGSIRNKFLQRFVESLFHYIKTY